MLRALVLAVGLGVAHPHGFITTPKSRNTLVCDKIWPDYLKHYNSDNFVCKTDRESHCPPMPAKKEKDCQGKNEKDTVTGTRVDAPGWRKTPARARRARTAGADVRVAAAKSRQARYGTAC
jgi:hypothetical protein